jgi:hypothetical protein
LSKVETGFAAAGGDFSLIPGALPWQIAMAMESAYVANVPERDVESVMHKHSGRGEIAPFFLNKQTPTGSKEATGGRKVHGRRVIRLKVP